MPVLLIVLLLIRTFRQFLLGGNGVVIGKNKAAALHNHIGGIAQHTQLAPE
jgi:hypothetical protein